MMGGIQFYLVRNLPLRAYYVLVSIYLLAVLATAMLVFSVPSPVKTWIAGFQFIMDGIYQLLGGASQLRAD